jgi:hypothetical protein
MNDYLNSLVDRTLRLAPVVQPRLASLFEPASTAPEPEATTMLETSSMPVASQPTETGPQAVSSIISLPIQASRPAPSERVGVTDAPAHRQTPNAEDRGRVDQQINPLPSLVPPAPVADQIIQQAMFSQTSLKPIDDEAPARHEAGLPNPFDAGAMKSSGEAQVYQSRLVKKPEVQRESAAKDRQPVQPALISLKSQSVTVPYAAKQPATTRPTSAQASTPSDGPETVVVTIGRVDVRAVFTPPAAAQRSNRPEQPKPMSLDEYLKQRREGRI